MHTHIIPKHLPKWTEKFGYGNFIHLEHVEDGVADMMQGGKFFRRIQENCWNEDLRIKEYKQFHTQVQVVCTIPVLFSYWAKPEDCEELSKFLNDHIANLVSLYPKNYIGLGTIPMQDTETAIRELKRCKEIGLVGIQIGSNINTENLNEEKFFPIFEACQELGIAVLIHPWQMMGFDQLQKYWLPWLVGMPAETSRAICSLIFGGIFEKLPRLRVAFAHGGGSFPSTIGRIEHGFACRPDLVAIDNQVNPRTYVGKFWFDSLVHDEKMLRFLVDFAGANRVALGSDYPFPLGENVPGFMIKQTDYSNEAKAQLLHGAALEWLQMNKANFI